MNEIALNDSNHLPTVFFIDDSATMREVMKIAFKRENIGVVACHDAATALAQIVEAPPDVVITDVIMPDKDGFEVCQFIKQNPKLQKTPVVLLSGVVNREVADKAFSVKADELIRKPFQPQDLIARVKQLLAPKNPGAPVLAIQAPSPSVSASLKTGVGLTGIFNIQPPPPKVAAPPVIPAKAISSRAPIVPPPPSPAARPGIGDVSKLRLEVMRLENLVKKLQSELVAERDYSRALEAHIKTLQDSE